MRQKKGEMKFQIGRVDGEVNVATGTPSLNHSIAQPTDVTPVTVTSGNVGANEIDGSVA